MNLKSLLAKKGKDYFYIMHLSYGRGKRHMREPLWEYAKKNDIIGLDLPDLVNDDWNKVKELVKERISGNWQRQFELFYNQMKKGDIVVILSGWKSVLGVAEVTDNKPKYDKKLKVEENFFEHVRGVSWYPFDEPHVLKYQVIGFNNTLQKVERGTKWWASLATIEIT